MLASNTINSALVKQMVADNTIKTVAIIGQPGGWTVILKIGHLEKVLSAQLSDTPRIWRSLDRCVAYLKNELNLSCIETLDATHFSHQPVTIAAGNAQQAAAYDQWLKAEIQEAIDDASPTIAHDEVMRDVREIIRQARLKRVSA